MIHLEDINKDAVLNGILPGQSVKIVSIEPVGDDVREIASEIIVFNRLQNNPVLT